MYRRSAARLAKHEGPGPEVLPEIPVASIADLFPQREDLGQALLDVAEDRRESLLLHHVWGFTFREIGNMLGISERAAKLRAFELSGCSTENASKPTEPAR